MNTVKPMTFYQHPNAEIRNDQERARVHALTAVSTGRVRWSSEIGLHGGFVIRDRFGIDQRLCLTDAIAMHELHAAGLISLDHNGRAIRSEQKASA